jgi:hypothetical protein
VECFFTSLKEKPGTPIEVATRRMPWWRLRQPGRPAAQGRNRTNRAPTSDQQGTERGHSDTRRADRADAGHPHSVSHLVRPRLSNA